MIISPPLSTRKLEFASDTTHISLIAGVPLGIEISGVPDDEPEKPPLVGQSAESAAQQQKRREPKLLASHVLSLPPGA